MYLIGTDEAGYGPNLGPLVVSATVWRVPESLGQADLYELLQDAVVADCCLEDDPRLPIADSKRLYAAGQSWEQLELGLLSALAACGHSCSCWLDAWRILCLEELPRVAGEPWHAGFDRPLPHAAQPAAIQQRAERFSAALKNASVELRAVFSRPVFAGEFNKLLRKHDNKAALLSHVSLELVRNVVALMQINEPLVVHCDKHGGRNFYAGLLQHFFPDYLMEVHCEGRDKSVYRSGPRERRTEFRFVAKGEGFLPAALASMACKYLRELSMQAFNHFWQQHLPELRPTAGYPDDARRFWKEIAPTQKKLQISNSVLWRKR